MKKLVAALAALPLSVLAVDNVGTNITENVTSVGNAVSGAVGDAANAAAPVIVIVIGIGLSLWILPTIVGVLKRAFGSGKGR